MDGRGRIVASGAVEVDGESYTAEAHPGGGRRPAERAGAARARARDHLGRRARAHGGQTWPCARGRRRLHRRGARDHLPCPRRRDHAGHPPHRAAARVRPRRARRRHRGDEAARAGHPLEHHGPSPRARRRAARAAHDGRADPGRYGAVRHRPRRRSPIPRNLGLERARRAHGPVRRDLRRCRRTGAACPASTRSATAATMPGRGWTPAASISRRWRSPKAG